VGRDLAKNLAVFRLSVGGAAKLYVSDGGSELFTYIVNGWKQFAVHGSSFVGNGWREDITEN